MALYSISVAPLLLSLLLTIIMLLSPSLQYEDPRIIDRIVRDSAFHSFPKNHRTAHLYRVQVPSNLSGITADVVRLRAGSLRRHGASIKEFSFAPGVVVHPRMKRLVVVRQNLGNHSYVYRTYQNISGYKLLSPVLGLLIYDAANLCRNRTRYPSELDIFVKKKPITINFSDVVGAMDENRSMCAAFQLDGSVVLSNWTDRSGCATWRQGHFAIVVESSSRRGEESKMKPVSRWKIVVMSVIGGAFGSVLLGLVAVAMVSVKRRKARIAELERRAYEEEALQVSMVGHVRAPTAAMARTTPSLENDYNPSSLS